MKTITTACVNHKGGVAKTTSLLNLAAGIARLHGKKVCIIDADPQANTTMAAFGEEMASLPQDVMLESVLQEVMQDRPLELKPLTWLDRVLLADLDPQGNATSGVGINKREVKISSYHVLMEESGAAEAILPTRFEGLWVLPSNIDLAGAEIELVEKENRAKSLRAALLRVKDDYDFIFIDCPPSLGLITVNALTASDTILIPIQCEYYALEGLTQLMQTVRTVKRLYNNAIGVEGVLLTMYDSRLNLTNQVVGEIKKYFADKVFRSTVPRSVRISEAPSYGEPICYYDKANRGALAYQRVAEELLERNGR